MQNPVICKSCNTENALFRLNCTKCNNYLRAKVWNINLWHDIRLLIETPTKGFTNIIWSEHKNFIVFILFITSIKFMIDSFFLKMTTGENTFLDHNFFISFLIILAETSVLILLFTFIIRIINRSFNVETRFKDILAIISYSLFPNIFALFSLFLVEIILFGGYLFSLNPAPVVIKPLLAYTLIAFESLVIFWCIFLLAFGFYTLTKLKLYSIVSSILFFFILILVLYFTSYNIL
ncbi:MAG: hypothetical protein COW08_04580 [Ignavibacteriales bacterium CG12_big_fil_rev_8_21_14_0_65_30_8]|nr:MAG: hypothetical protein COW08_04580 [Ignavibacteriales bacterium CG12_big_fil_rev_8_21_14_0_65_30_8]